MQQLIEKFRENSLKATPQRMAIYKELIGDKSHPSAENIYRRIKSAYPSISFDTVNRTLTMFAEIGLLKIVEGRGCSRRFDFDTGIHHHLHCIKCGSIIDFSSKTLDEIEIPASIAKKHKVLSRRIVLEAICEECLKKQKQETETIK
jgi:Fur family transcriptional regulator, peroxide stress response regulator